jgi:hypothetical protein
LICDETLRLQLLSDGTNLVTEDETPVPEDCGTKLTAGGLESTFGGLLRKVGMKDFFLFRLETY